MKSYSQRIGLTPEQKPIQTTEMDQDLRNSIWNILHTFYLSDAHSQFVPEEVKNLLRSMRIHFFKERIDEIFSFSMEAERVKRFVLESEWHRVYDYVQAVPMYFEPQYGQEGLNDKVRSIFNNMFETESAPCRFVGEELVNITDQTEVDEVEKAMVYQDKYALVSVHFKKAVRLLADKQKPDFSNSVKESITAVEATCQALTGNPKAVLDDALKLLAKKNDLHPALKDAFVKLYGYAGDADGIRHALSVDSNLGYDDAKFMLVSCSAFSNYLICKIAKGTK